MLCDTCYYKHKEKAKKLYVGCNYCLMTGELRLCDKENCNKYRDDPIDYDDRKSCKNCKYYDSKETFKGYCKEKEIETLSYHPSCKEFVKG